VLEIHAIELSAHEGLELGEARVLLLPQAVYFVTETVAELTEPAVVVAHLTTEKQGTNLIHARIFIGLRLSLSLLTWRLL
jgi:hypothetical protein